VKFIIALDYGKNEQYDNGINNQTNPRRTKEEPVTSTPKSRGSIFLEKK
jgi:hypothetical protein